MSPEEEGGPVEVVLEGLPAAMALAPSGGSVALGGELPLGPEGARAVESMRAGLLQAGPLAVAGVLANGANVVVTVAVARILSPHSYGVLNQLTGLFLILSMPGSAVVVAVVRRVTMWHESERHLARRWAVRLRRRASLAVVVWAVVVFVSRNWIAQLLGQRSGVGVAAILTAAAVFVLLSLDRGLLQARRAYRPLAANLLVEGGMRTVAVLALVGAGAGASGAAVGVLVAEVLTSAQVRLSAVRAWSDHTHRRPPRAPDPVPDEVGSGSVPDRHRVGVDLVIASFSLSMVAVLQNVDVLVVGRDSPSLSGAYAAVSVTSKAIVFGAVVLGGYLLPEAAIRWRQGGHALRQLGVVLVLLAIPAAALLAVAVGAPHVLLKDVFHHAYAATASTLAPLGVAMILLSISVILTMYLLAIGRRWVAGVLAAGALALGLAVSLVHGRPHATGLVDLAVQAGVLGVILVGFTAVHRVRLTGHPSAEQLW